MQHNQGAVRAAQVLSLRAGAARLSLALGLASLAAGASARAQDVAAPAASASQPTLREMVRQRQGELDGASVTQIARSLPPSLPTALGLDARQTERLSRLYGDFLLARVEQEGKIARWQDDLKRAQSPTTFNEGKSRGLLKSIAEAQDKVRVAFLKVRGEALRTLTPSQRAQVQALAASLRPDEQPGLPASERGVDDLPSVRVDEFRALLLMPVERLLATPLDVSAARRVLAERASNRLGYSSSRYGTGRYGRYGFGTSVFGGFGWGHGFGGIHGSFGHRHGFGGHPQHGGAHH